MQDYDIYTPSKVKGEPEFESLLENDVFPQ